MAMIYESQTDLGKRFGVSCKKIGMWLRALGLRDEHGKPTKEGWKYAKALPVDPDGDPSHVFYVWQVYGILPLLEEYSNSQQSGGAK